MPAHSGFFDIRTPLRPSYFISCSIRPPSSFSANDSTSNSTSSASFEDLQLIHIACCINTPLPLCKKSLLRRADAYSHFFSLFKELNQVFEHFNASFQWQEFLTARSIDMGSSKRESSGNHRVGQLKESFKNGRYSIDSLRNSREYRELVSELKQRATNRVALRHINNLRDSFSSSSAHSASKASSIPIFASSCSKKGRMQSEIETDVDQFFCRGHVMIKNIDNPIQEISKLQKLRRILIKYGHFINFQLSHWYVVFIILSGSDEVYSSRRVRSRYILTVPQKFDAESFLDFCRAQIPMADLLYEDTDAVSTGDSIWKTDGVKR